MNSPVLDSPAPTPPPHSSNPSRRSSPVRLFTIDGSAALEKRLHDLCEQIRAALCGLLPPGKLEAILLGGGYGRGEGGVLSTPNGDQPYNDLEFYIFLRGNRHLNELRYHRPLEVLGQILTPQAGVDVDFKIASFDEFKRSPVSMFSYDLVSGHHQLLGPAGLFDGCAQHRLAENIPLMEASRLLMNRCSGLLFARERLERRNRFTAEDADYVRRNIAKAALAFGDAILTVRGQYHWSCRERHHRLLELTPDPTLRCLDQVRRHHKVGVSFKLHPQRSNGVFSQLETHHAEVTALGLQLWLWLESLRLNTTFSSVKDYVDDPRDKCPGTYATRNWLVNLKTLGPKTGLACFRHPRERVLHALTLLLWEPDVMASHRWRKRLHAELCTYAPDFPGIICDYRTLWARVN